MTSNLLTVVDIKRAGECSLIRAEMGQITEGN